MEYVGLLKDMWSSISNYFNYHKILNENCTTLREKRKRLQCREQDINTKLENAQYNQAGERSYFLRFSFLSQFEANMKKVDEMFELGNFPNGILIDVHQDEGNAFIRRLQDAIARKINLDFSKEEDEKIRAALLSEELQKKKKFFLILDDVWEVYTPREVGIPIGIDGGKLIITTRSRNVCLRMGCKEIIKMEPLSEEEAWELFNKTLEWYNALSKKEEKIAKDIIKECGDLPLAIVTTTRSMSVVYSIVKWRNALNELREHVKGHTIDMENDVFKILEFSYNRLNGEKLQECLLYYALFPEDFKIRRVFLIRYWIAEGLVEEMGSWQTERDRRHAILDKLENVCLLERCGNGQYVKMHDMIRDMAINITTKNSRFMVKIIRNLEDLPSEIEWSNNVERVSLKQSGGLSTFMFVPNWPKLSTLFLHNHRLPNPFIRGLDKGLPNSFFVHMLGLRVLDLSHTDIAFLPDSIYDKVKLRALILYYCPKLKRVGSLAKLKEFRELNLGDNQMEAIHNGIEKLVHFKHFYWYLYTLYSKPFFIPLSNLVQLQCLRLIDRRLPDIGVEELSGLRKLEILDVKFSNLHNFNSYMRTKHYQRLTHYRVRLNGFGYFLGENFHFCKEVTVEACKLEGGKDNDDYHLILLTNVRFFQITKCHLPIGLFDVSQSLKMATNLKACLISRCVGIEYLWLVEDCIASLKWLFLDELPSLGVLFKLRPTNIVRCSSLKHLYMSNCSNLNHLFTPKLVKYHLKNLQTIHVCYCRQMEDLIVVAEEEEEEEKEEKKEKEEEEEEEENINEMNNLILCFPNLQSLLLEDLPKLKSKFEEGPIGLYCQKLRRLPLSVHINDGDGERQPLTSPLRQIREEKKCWELTVMNCLKLRRPPLSVHINDEWWDGLEWNTHPRSKFIFQPLNLIEFWGLQINYNYFIIKYKNFF
ncbi:hypothetical protein PVL29_026089 [Vitis rotundifolia]|uniref:NB-ARC domain-containing protein n=1 Tax=Vitis rotundifolia TaxID=103349 RepID=A0AA38YLM0_VITRO|nr:hypothetical protein PVL29_026089 [Vitis rotundifolia]